ncbi:MAG: tetratricopeptide repeat protein [Methanobacteriota archaeon]
MDYNDIGESWYLEGNYDAAISAYLKATTLNRYYAEAWNNLGLAYNQKDQNIEAISAFKWAVLINPRYTEAWNNLGDIYTKMGRSDDAREAYQKAGSFNSNNQQNQFPPPAPQWNQPSFMSNNQGVNNHNQPPEAPLVSFPSQGNKKPGQFPERYYSYRY